MHRSGCKGAEVGCYATSWGECARNAHLRVGWANSANGFDLTTEKKWDQENERYEKAVREGFDPPGCDNAGVDAAYRKAELAEKVDGMF
jgi:hypothetical protein